MKKTLKFQTEVTQLLQLMIHSLYSNKEIFLRELISNSADAIDKLRFESLNNSSLLENDSELKITITANSENSTITISDNGIGMDSKEIIDNLGTIAKSGTKSFFDKLTGDAKKDSHLIGQFGVGFYSAFMVADEVTVITRKADSKKEDGVKWQSKADGDFTVENVTKEDKGTDVILHIKDSEKNLLSDWALRRIVTTYSDHINIPIYMKKAPDYDKDGNIIQSNELEVVNQAQAIWTKNKNEITDEQYKEFYKHIAHDFEDPLAWTHSKVEGKQEYIELLYIPKRAPFDLYDKDAKHGVKLYVKRVFIMDDAKKLMPTYLRFIKGVVDSNDLPLNVSREILQESKDIESIRSGCVKKVLSLIESLNKKDLEKYSEFWKNFGQVFKEGIAEDYSNQQKIASLCRFASTFNKTEEQNVSLDDYLKRMKEGQDKIYYITADNYASAKNSPHLEIFIKKGIEILLLTDRIDEWVVSSLTQYQEKKLTSVAKGALDLGNLIDEKEKKEQQKIETENKDIVEIFKNILKDKVSDVRATNRLTESPACLVVGENEMSAHLARMLESAGAKEQIPISKPILELNPSHLLVKGLINNEEDQSKKEEIVNLIYDQALLAEGGKLDNPASFVKRINNLILSFSH